MVGITTQRLIADVFCDAPPEPDDDIQTVAMDAKKIYELFRSAEGPLIARLQFGAGLTEVQIRRVEPQGMIVTGEYIPQRGTPVSVLVRNLAVEGVVGSRTEVQCRIKFLRPAELETPY